MHDILSARLDRLTDAGSSAGTNQTFKSDLMDLAKLCQIDPRNDYLLEAVAGPLMHEVQLVFGAASLIVVLTEAGRRQVYFAVIARLKSTGELDELGASEEKRRQLIESLVLHTSTDLIAAHYGSCPAGFLRVLARIGDRARHTEIYGNLHKLVAGAPGLTRELLSVTSATGLSNNMVELLMNMPHAADAVRLARQFEDVPDYHGFISLYRILTGQQTLAGEHRARLCSGEKPGHLLEALYLDLPFPPPAIAAPGLRHVGNGAELVSVSKTFRNCLADFVPEALKGEHQYYVWSKKDAPEIVIRIRNDAPFGWFLSEMKSAENRYVPIALKREISALLEHCGVRAGCAIADMVHQYQPPFFAEDIGQPPDLDVA